MRDFSFTEHPNIKVFITQGGLQSTDEAISAGVPLIGVPMFADQWYNIERYEKHNIGLRLEPELLDDETLEDAINKVIGDDRLVLLNVINVKFCEYGCKNVIV